jgi:hypothetical protein
VDFVTANKFAEDAEVGEATVESGIPVCFHFFEENICSSIFFSFVKERNVRVFLCFGSGYAFLKINPPPSPLCLDPHGSTIHIFDGSGSVPRLSFPDTKDKIT